MKRKPTTPQSVKTIAGCAALVDQHIDAALAAAMRENVSAVVTYGEGSPCHGGSPKRRLYLWLATDNVTVTAASYVR